ncbi:MAG TPA: hypothetical protein VKF15_08420 [Nitrososphaerales archaeon]|nr:hypothetical protein [Nitrososphaerales archaeon]
MVAPSAIGLSPADERLLALMRTRGLSIKDLDPDDRERLRSFLVELHLDRGVSLTDIAKMVGNKTSGYTSWLCRQLGIEARPFEEARLKGIKEKRRKYERTPFDGTDEDRAYMLGLRHGDLSVSTPWKGAVRVSTSTTHPAMAELFRSLFESYGHVYQYARYKKDTQTYEWNVQTILDESFAFLLQEFSDAKSWIEQSETLTLAYLSGFIDAEGSILVTHSTRGAIVIFVDYFNENKTLLEWIAERARSLGLGTSLRINKPIGRGTTGFHLNHNREYWQLSTFSAHGILGFVERLRLRHPQKLLRRSLALSTLSKTRYEDIALQNAALRAGIKDGVSRFVKLAEETYLKSHPSPREKDAEPSQNLPTVE